MRRMNQIKLYFLTGFLGSGKTTLLKNLLENLEHAFAPGGDPERLPTDFRRVIIIDDIYTTGNTVDQVAKVLKTMGFQKVYFLTISIGQGY